jgi:D-cysteine desulfhydrase
MRLNGCADTNSHAGDDSGEIVIDLREPLEHYPRLPLTRTPTPFQRLPHLTHAVGGPRLWMKRDDLTDLAFGGDKPRKLEYELAAAVAQGANTLVTTGSAQSNFARLLTAAARRLGLASAVVLSAEGHPESQGNLLAVRLMGAEVHLVDTGDHWALDEEASRLVADLRDRGRRPYLVPVSGTTPLGCLGCVRAGLELVDQIHAEHLEPAAVYTPFGTGGVFTGILLALRANDLTCPLIGISVNRDADTCYQYLDTWWSGLANLLTIEPLDRGHVKIHDRYIGAGYGDPTPAALDAICLTAETEGLIVDPVYSGKVMAGLFDHIDNGRWTDDDDLIVVHSGGAPAIFAYHTELNTHLNQRPPYQLR